MECFICSKTFKAQTERSKFCSIGCKSKFQSFDLDIVIVSDLYRANFSQVEIAYILGTTQKVIFSHMKKNGIKSRKQASRNQRGENNNNWKKDRITYSAAHRRVEVERGKPNECEQCKTKTDKKFEWANISGNYFDPFDFKRLCKSCHIKFDAKRRTKLKGNTMNLFKKGGRP